MIERARWQGIALSAVLGCMMAGCGDTPSPSGLDAPPAPLAAISVRADALGPVIPRDFDGISLEYSGVSAYLGSTPTQPNTIFHQLLENLGQGSLRIGGIGGDRSCWASRVAAPPPYCGFTITPDLLRVIFGAAWAVHWRVLLSVNLANNDPVAAVDYARDGIGANATPDVLLGLEIGNEPDLYASTRWYTITRANGVTTTVNMRPSPYLFSQYVDEFSSYVDALNGNDATAWMPVVGPESTTGQWDRYLRTFISAVGSKRLAFITIHYYPYNVCTPRDAAQATISNLLAQRTMDIMVRHLGRVVAAARASGKGVQVSETNSISCGGKPGVSNTFAAALWGLDHLFTLARLGMDRVNFHTGQWTDYTPVGQVVRSRATGALTYVNRVYPLYYAMLLFKNAVNLRFLPVAVNGSGANIKAYAVGDRSITRIFVLNKDLSASGSVVVNVEPRPRNATALVLRAPSLSATTGTTLGGRTIDAMTGKLRAPRTHTLVPDPATGGYSVTVPHASAVMLSFSR